MNNKTYECSFCEKSFFSNDDRLSHENICVSNSKLSKEKIFKNRLNIKKKKD